MGWSYLCLPKIFFNIPLFFISILTCVWMCAETCLYWEEKWLPVTSWLMVIHRTLPVAYDRNHVCSVISKILTCLHCFCVRIHILLKYCFVLVNFISTFCCTSFPKTSRTSAYIFSLLTIKLYSGEKYLMSCQRSNPYRVHLFRIKVPGSSAVSPSACHVGVQSDPGSRGRRV